MWPVVSVTSSPQPTSLALSLSFSSIGNGSPRSNKHIDNVPISLSFEFNVDSVSVAHTIGTLGIVTSSSLVAGNSGEV